ncbi:MarR family transcriptional regulator [Acidisoma cellulosilytica]|uniref:MarR family transcriptional regulator n=1 Tax=Acidisoma cellulosilyticum TaxID=2802395 RepID=A0A963YZ19_9PROT|nr:MarR family transcriptional regulator [Acidisoma cellulosilyticum]MCB8879709.1 MarR family transcriptional regulator [Acidisoma cellulosilyticum]
MSQSLTKPIDQLGYWLYQVSNQVTICISQKLAELDVIPAEWVMLSLLYDQPSLAPSEIANQMAMTRGAITKLADRAIAKNLVRRRADDHDGRAQTLTLTKAGRAFVPKLAALADASEAACFDNLSVNDRRHLRRILKLAAAGLDLPISQAG